MYKSSNTGKGIHKVNAWATISRNGGSDIEFSQTIWTLIFIERCLKKYKVFKKLEEQKLFYNEIMLHLMLAQKFKILWEEQNWVNWMAIKITRFKFCWKYLGYCKKRFRKKKSNQTSRDYWKYSGNMEKFRSRDH